MIITADLIEAYLKCPTKCFLLSRDEIGTGNAYAEWARTIRTNFCNEGIGRLVAGVAPNKCVLGTSAVENLQWQLAIDFKVRSQNLQCSCQAVEHIPSLRRSRAAQFIPIRFAFRNKAARDDKLLITFDALILSERLGRAIDHGKVLYGANYASLRVKTSAFADEVRRLIEEVSGLLANPTPPDLVLNRHCTECQFQTRCRQKAVDRDDLSLLGNMTEKERAEFNSKGIFTVTQLSYTFRPRHRPKDLKDKREKYHHSLKARAIRERKIYIVGSPKLEIDGIDAHLFTSMLRPYQTGTSTT